MRAIFSFVVAALLMSFAPSAASAAAKVSLGSGYSCLASSKQIFSKGHVVKLSVAASSLSKQLSDAKKLLKAEQKKKKPNAAKIAALTKKVSTLQTLLAALKNCAKGIAGGIDPFWSSLSGNYPNGIFSFSLGDNQIPGTIKSTFTLSGTTFTVHIELGGDAFVTIYGTDPIDFHFDVNGVAFPKVVEVPGTLLGDMTFTFVNDGHVSAVAVNPPQNDYTRAFQISKTEFDGVLSNGEVDGSLTITTGFAPLTGTFSFKR